MENLFTTEIYIKNSQLNSKLWLLLKNQNVIKIRKYYQIIFKLIALIKI